MKKAKLILGAILIAGVTYAAGQNFTVIVNGQVSDLQGVVVNNRLYVPADVLPDLGIRISAAPGVLSLSSDAGGGSRGSVSVTTPSTVVTGGSAVRSKDYKSQSFKTGDLIVNLNRCYRSLAEEVICDLIVLNNGNDDSYYLYANDGSYASRFILEDGTEFTSSGAKVVGDKEWQNRLYKLFRSQITYTVQVRFNLPSYVTQVKYFDVRWGDRFRINGVVIE